MDTIHSTIRQQQRFKEAENKVKKDFIALELEKMFIAFGHRDAAAKTRAMNWAQDFIYYSVDTMKEACKIAKEQLDRMPQQKHLREIIKSQVESSLSPQNSGYEPCKEAEQHRARARQIYAQALEKYGTEEMNTRLKKYMEENPYNALLGEKYCARLLVIDMRKAGEV